MTGPYANNLHLIVAIMYFKLGLHSHVKHSKYTMGNVCT